MNWIFNDPLKEAALIQKFERKIDYQFPEDFRQCGLKNNGAYAETDELTQTKWKAGRSTTCFLFILMTVAALGRWGLDWMRRTKHTWK